MKLVEVIMTKKKINHAIKHLGLTIEGARGDGCFYFLDEYGSQIGKTVYICYLNQLSVDEWIQEAEGAKDQGVI